MVHPTGQLVGTVEGTRVSDAERDATLFPRPVGEQLRAEREAQGIALAEVASRTRVPLRHLEAIESSNFAGLPSATYAVGFVRAYARAIGVDEVPLARAVREEVARTTPPTPRYEPYEVADPARVPSRAVVIVASGLALGVLILAILWFTSSWSGGRSTPVASVPPLITPVPAVTVPPGQPAAGAGQVTLTARGEVWMRVYDAANTTLFLGTMKPGDRFDVPSDANDPMINVGRPDQLAVTLNGAAVPPLGTGERAIKDVPVSAAAMAARMTGNEPAPSPSPSPAAAIGQQSAEPERATRPPTRPAATAGRARPRIVPARDNETRRANLRALERGPSPDVTPTP